ncbi:hypothetical protein MTO96_037601 [Rhipicephalus appendiculatus]
MINWLGEPVMSTALILRSSLRKTGACAMSSFFALAGWRSMGLLFVAMLETFQVTRVDASWPIVVLGALGYMAAIGTGMVYIVATPTIISEHFVKNKGLAMGLNYGRRHRGPFRVP